jgi:hypothetical protein
MITPAVSFQNCPAARRTSSAGAWAERCCRGAGGSSTQGVAGYGGYVVEWTRRGDVFVRPCQPQEAAGVGALFPRAQSLLSIFQASAERWDCAPLRAGTRRFSARDSFSEQFAEQRPIDRCLTACGRGGKLHCTLCPRTGTLQGRPHFVLPILGSVSGERECSGPVSAEATTAGRKRGHSRMASS